MSHTSVPYGKAMQILLDLAARDVDYCVLWPYTIERSTGYIKIGPQRGHVIVCEQHHGPRPAGHEAAHICGNRTCVNPRHLRWATPKENSADKRIHGTLNIGERNGMAKLTAQDVNDIRHRRARGESAASIAVDYGITAIYLRTVIRRGTWSHVA